MLLANALNHTHPYPNRLCPFVFAVISGGYYNKSPQTGGLKQGDFILSKSGGQKSEVSITGPKPRCGQGLALPGGSRGESVPSLFLLLVAASIP